MRALVFALVATMLAIAPAGRLRAAPAQFEIDKVRAHALDEREIARRLGDVAAGASLRRAYVERRFSTLFNAPLESSGELRFIAAQRFEKHVLRPQRETLVIDGGEARIERPGQPARAIRLDAWPALRLLALSMRATLAGDAAALHAAFETTALAVGERWQLSLVPRDPALLALDTRIVIDGDAHRLLRFEFFEASGDRVEMWLLDSAAQPGGPSR